VSAHPWSWRTIAYSRLFHFVAAGALLAALAPRERDDRTVVIDAPRVDDALTAERARHGRVPTTEEKTEAVQTLVDEEVLAREAVRTGIGTSDPVVRARLAEQMRVSLARALPPPRVAANEIDLATAREIERAPERVRLAVWFVAKDRADAAREAEAIVRRVRAEGAAGARGRGEHPPIPDGALWTEEALARVAGAGVARAAMTAAIGEPTDALPSAWGFYVLVPLERRRAEPAEVRADALAAIVRARQAKELELSIRRVRRDYGVEVRSPAGEARFDIDAPTTPQSERVD